MKKYLLILSFLFSAITSFAQYPLTSNIGGDSTLVDSKGATKSRFVNVNFTDTTAANLQRIKAYPGAQIFTTSDNSFWTRNRTATRWIRVNGYCGGLIGGIVSYSGTGLTLNVTAATQYCINNISYSAPATSVTLTTANPSNPRFDLIVSDTFGVISAITGTAAASPVLPQANPLSQYPLAYISVPAGATTPGGITTTVIYDENTGGEWTHTTFGAITSNFNDVVNPFHLTKDIRTTNINASARVGIQFDNGAPIQAVNYNSLNVHIAPITASATNIIVSLTKEDVVNTIPISIPVSASTAYQTLSIPLSSFSFTGAGDFFDGIQIQFTTNSTTGYYLDYITLQSGITPPPTGSYWTRNGNHLYPTAIGDSVGIKTNNPGYPLDVNGLAHVGSLYIQDGGDDAYIGTAGGGMGEYVDATQNFTYANNSFGANGNDFWVNHPPTAADADSIWGFTGDHLIKIPKPSAGGSGTVINVTATYPIQITGTSTLTPNVKADTGRSLTQLVTGFDLNKVRDSVQANLIDSLRRLSGSVNVQARKNGVWITQYQDSANGDFIPITGTTPGHNVTGDVISDREFYAEGFHSGQTITSFGQITSGTNSHQGSFELFDGGAGNSATIRTDAQSGTAGILLIPDLNSTTITSLISVDGLFANAAGNVDLPPPIPLAGTTGGNPVTGNVEVYNGFTLHTEDISNGISSLILDSPTAILHSENSGNTIFSDFIVSYNQAAFVNNTNDVKFGFNNSNPGETVDIGGGLNVGGKVKLNRTEINADYVVGDNDYTIIVNNAGANITITLPDATAGLNRIIIVKRFDNTSTGTITIISASGNVQDFTDGSMPASVVISPWGATGRVQRFQANGTNWEVEASN